ncbi:hypothetical protein ACFRAO_40680 [Streptomyces sp. NPDC056656]|uniref:NACHT N-terminal Helical domain 1-containing protein n=1 Tax=Streptomyces sp. NPDC056656 TaxID=3345895 RepID=UPI003675DC02
MNPAGLGTRLASSVLSPLVKQLLTRDGPGAGLVDKPVRLSGLVTFRGEKRTLGEKGVGHLAARLVREGRAVPGRAPVPRGRAGGGRGRPRPQAPCPRRPGHGRPPGGPPRPPAAGPHPA